MTTELVKTLEEIGFFHAHTRELPLFTLSIATMGYTETSQTLFGWSFKNILFISKNGLEQSFRDPNDDKRFFDFISTNEEEKAHFFQEKSNEVLIDANQLIIDLESEIENSEENVLQLIKRIGKTYSSVGSLLGISRPAGDYFEGKKSTKAEVFGLIRKEHGLVYTKIEKSLSKFFDLLSARWAIDPVLLCQLSFHELEELVSAGQKPNRLALERRRELYALSFTGGKTSIFVGEDANELFNYFNKADSPNASFVVGRPAFIGKVSGTARIVFSEKDLEKIKNGDIIVSPMTQVSFVPALTRVSGIITDEGGITCHAAVIAREMKKPCIVGTKNATKLIADGDQIEIDGDKITILKK